MAVVAVLGGSFYGHDTPEYKAAETIGKILAEHKIDIVTGGYGGIMEAPLRGANGYGVRRIGVITKFYQGRQANEYVSELIETETYIDRLTQLVQIADAYIILPGETGTLLELSAIWALKEKGIISKKPFICLGDQWNEVIQTMSFYSERLLDQSDLISYSETADDAAYFIINSLETA